MEFFANLSDRALEQISDGKYRSTSKVRPALA